MGLLKRAGDLVYTFRFLKLLVTNFEDTEAFKLGLIDAKGKRLRKSETPEDKNAYTPFHRLVFNVKKLIPGGKIGSYASALYLIKEKFSIPQRTIEEAMKDLGISSLDFLAEDTQWFVLEDGSLSPGDYRVVSEKVLNETCDDIVQKKDFVTAGPQCLPVGDFHGLPIYEVSHKRSGKSVYVSVSELLR
jgi:hypothetical protein|tara:strand:+ start:537 stop:1103 length:567 start_codon:yes stop_codon:yes gene_type:complete